MRDFLHHAAKSRGVRPLHGLVHLLEPQGAHDDLVLLRRADGAPDQFDFDRAGHGYPTFSVTRPRRLATSALSRSCSKASMVALTTLCGLCDPMDFVRTLGMPTAWMTARTGPPAITPVPSGAGFSSTRPLPNWPSTGCWMVVASTCTLRRFFLAASMPFLIAAGTSLALPVP